MLLISQISSVEMHSPEWFLGRLSKFTSSEIHNLMGDKEFTQGAMSYIYRKVGEELTGVASKDSIDTQATIHGNEYEKDAIRKYAEKEKLEFLVTQKMILGLDGKTSSTPDAIKIISPVPKQEAYNVHPIEIKCPLTYEAYIALALCETPQDVCRVEKKYYWQLLDQMHNCGALTGTLVVYHPYFKTGQLKAIEFRIMEEVLVKENKGSVSSRVTYPMKDDLDFLKARKLSAIKKFEEVKQKIYSL